ncbi:septum formation family protein [Microbacterium sp. A82]|uniref:septum formation family protein n=1 Tax=Microbacterium sp. A82 TaxID=3450452 RepID=UPI003F376BA9
MKMRTRTAWAFAGSAVALSLALSGCSSMVLGVGDAQRDDGGNVTEEATIDIFSLKVGDCMPESDTTGDIQDTPVVPCEEPHTNEVFFEFELTGDTLPSDDEITAEVEAQCVPAFADFVGFDYFESVLDFWWLTPTEETWDSADDRLVQCVLYEPDPADPTGEASLEITGSLKGATR